MTEQPEDSFFTELIEGCKPTQVVSVETAAGKTLIFHQLISGSELDDFKARAQKFVRMAKTAPGKEWANLVPKGPLADRVLGRVFTIHDRSFDPKIPIKWAFEICEQAPFLRDQIINELAVASSQGLIRRLEEMAEEEGNASEQTSGGETLSLSAESISPDETLAS